MKKEVILTLFALASITLAGCAQADKSAFESSVAETAPAVTTVAAAETVPETTTVTASSETTATTVTTAETTTASEVTTTAKETKKQPSSEATTTKKKTVTTSKKATTVTTTAKKKPVTTTTTKAKPKVTTTTTVKKKPVTTTTAKKVTLTQADMDRLKIELQQYADDKAEAYKHCFDDTDITWQEVFEEEIKTYTPENNGWDPPYTADLTDSYEWIKSREKEAIDFHYSEVPESHIVIYIRWCPGGKDSDEYFHRENKTDCWDIYCLY